MSMYDKQGSPAVRPPHNSRGQGMVMARNGLVALSRPINQQRETEHLSTAPLPEKPSAPVSIGRSDSQLTLTV